MQHKIEFKDLNSAGKNAVFNARFMAIKVFREWGFDCGDVPFSNENQAATDALDQALVDFLVATNQPAKGVSNG